MYTTLSFKNAEQVVFVRENDHKDPLFFIEKFNAIQDWNITKCYSVIEMDTSDGFSCLNAHIHVKRVPWNYVIKVLACLLFKCLLSYLITLVFTIIAIEFASSGMLPSSSYLSISDYILLGCVIFIFLMFLYRVN